MSEPLCEMPVLKKGYYMARKRKIIQIAACGVDNVQSTQCNSFLYALCDDNSVWCIPNNDAKWFPVPPVPDAPDTNEKTDTSHNR